MCEPGGRAADDQQGADPEGPGGHGGAGSFRRSAGVQCRLTGCHATGGRAVRPVPDGAGIAPHSRKRDPEKVVGAGQMGAQSALCG